MTGFRLAQGGLVDRASPVKFRFDGKSYTGFAGDTLASALLASGVKLVGRSFKYHRPRGVFASGSEEPNALVELRAGAWREPNTRATMAEIFEGLEAASQNRGPSLKYDPLAVNNLLSPFLSAGFYYKTFMWPASFWEKFYEPMIRRAAGLGRNAGLPDPDIYEKTTEFCDVLVIGAGAEGIEAATQAAATGQRVILCDENAPLASLDLPAGVEFLARTTVFGVYDGGTYAALQRLTDHLPSSNAPRQRLVRIVAGRSVLATGALERPIAFGHNDLPGVMLNRAVGDYVTRYGVAPGRNILLYLNNDDAAGLIPVLHQAGVNIAGVVDARPASSDVVHDAARAANAPVYAGAAIIRATGWQGVSGAKIRLAKGGDLALPCDIIAVSGGFNPNLALTSHFDGKPVWDAAIAAFVPGSLPPCMSVVGKAAGQGLNANIQPVFHSGFFPGKSFLDLQNDVTVKDVKLAEQEGFAAVEHLKRYTTLGMATDQGKTSNVNAIGVLAQTLGKGIGETGTTRFRPPYVPVAIGALAGAHTGKEFKPTRLTPTHEWAAGLGAAFVETGLWLRAQYFPKPGEDWLAAAQREVNAVRNAVGICDVTTLGKIDIQGPDAAIFLERVYTNSWANLPIGKVRYGLMLREDGFVMDDGTTARLGETHFVMTTTTANAARVMQHLEFCAQVIWKELDVSLISVTDQWGQIAVAGPKSAATLAKIVDAPFDLSDEAFPYMACMELTVCGGVPARLFRISFSGERAYELAVPSRQADALARALIQAGAEFGIAPYGTEALGIMRIEKGHPAGPELNGQTSAHDLGMGKLLSKKKEFIGRAMAARPALTAPTRQTLVGLRPVNPQDIIRAGSHLLPVGAPAVAASDQGHVTSAARSPTLGSIALALLENGPARHGETLRVYDPLRGGDFTAIVTHPVHLDPEGHRLHA
ncbi:2Fe-2S iron-sulfur cluster-binding protein [Acidocella facilis]|uniref:2Fe-2S iron-sulfur cluster-binding protein n=1 Tax=Acidocella facilis TaxID=525 RepID=UPI001F309C25|nr:2Fe-2S iron-sulfur cluster-binding protein [Acidocella facilis]